MLYSVTSDPNDTNLQDDVNKVADWSKDNHMRLNTTKTKEMLISFNHPPPDVVKIEVDSFPLGRVECVTLLGVKLSCDLTWHLHVQHIL